PSGCVGAAPPVSSAQRSFQPPHLGFAAFDHLFSPNQMAQANHTSGEENSPRLSAKNPDSSRYGGSIRLQIVDTPTVEGKQHGVAPPVELRRGALSRPGEIGALCVPWFPDLAVAKEVVIAR